MEGHTPRKRLASPNFPGTLNIATSLPVPDRSATTSAYRSNGGQDTPSTLRTNQGTSIYSDRSLPPTPSSPTTPRPGSPFAGRSVPHDSARGRSLVSGATSRTGSPAHLSSTARSRSKSPSIANLDHLSVVKQRLSQIEQDPSRSPSPSPTSPSPSRKSTRTRELSPLTPTSARTAFREGDVQQLRNMRTSTGATVPASCQSPPIRNIHASSELSQAESTSEDAVTKSHPFRMSPADLQRSQVYEAARSMLVEHDRQGAIQEQATNEAELKDIQDKLDDIRHQVNSYSGIPPLGIVQMLEEMRARLKADLPEMMAKLREIKSSRGGDTTKDSSPSNVLHNIGPSSNAVTLPLDLSDVHAKLDNLLSMRQLDDDKQNQVTTSLAVQAERDLRSAQALELSAQVRIHLH
jgi:hypothetical protein